jgi:transposase InsO family protein
VLAGAELTVSMSRTGNCYDHAVTESFFGTLKGEGVERSCFQTPREARQTIFEYVECFYVRSVQPKLAFTGEGMAGKDMNLDNS